MSIKRTLISLSLTAILLSGCSGNDGGDTMNEVSDLTVSQTEISTAVEKEMQIPPSYDRQFSNKKKGIYNYCPSTMQMEDGTLYMYYCTNRDSYVIVDYIGCRKGIREEDGSIDWGEETLVFSPTEGTWDAHHTCDPSVIAGEFTYQGDTYGYLMAYLGCTSYDNQDNKVGLAVAKTPEGPFIRVGTEPLVDFEMDPTVTKFQWGVGQPSIINMDKKGKVMLFYTRGDKDGTRTVVEEWDLSNLDSPERLSSTNLSAHGLTNLNGGSDYMNNADFVYDSENKRFYATSDCHPSPSEEPNFISSHFRVTYFDEPENYSAFLWENYKTFSKAETGYRRNHNTGILRDEYGHLPDNGYLTVFYTMSRLGSDSLWSYGIYNCNIEIPTK